MSRKPIALLPAVPDMEWSRNRIKREKTVNNFEEMNLMAPIKRALSEEKYETPTPIQAKAIPSALEGKDVLGCAQTGTGKTAAFSLPILNRMGKRNRKSIPNRPYALILAPTRELAIQIGDSLSVYGKHLHLRHTLVYGGVSQLKQVRAMRRGVHVLVATPGRLLDLMEQGHIKLDRLEVFVLDEADRMLDMGFLPDLKRIMRELPEQRQSLFFSATLPPKITELATELLSDPISVNVTPKTRSVKKIEQRLMYVEGRGKQTLLRDVLALPEVDRVLVFTKTKRMANTVSQKLERYRIRAAAIHGNKSQNARQRALDDFRANKIQVLVATDVAARGLDIDGVSHVINYDLPIEPEAYVHRIGRTGRAGADGIAISFCTSSERRELRAIEALIGHKVPVDPDHADKSKPRSSQGRRPSQSHAPKRPRRTPKPRTEGQSTQEPRQEKDSDRSGTKTQSKRRNRNRNRNRRAKQTT